jgi:hypothetical protein
LHDQHLPRAINQPITGRFSYQVNLRPQIEQRLGGEMTLIPSGIRNETTLIKLPTHAPNAKIKPKPKRCGIQIKSVSFIVIVCCASSACRVGFRNQIRRSDAFNFSTRSIENFTTSSNKRCASAILAQTFLERNITRFDASDDRFQFRQRRFVCDAREILVNNCRSLACCTIGFRFAHTVESSDPPSEGFVGIALVDFEGTMRSTTLRICPSAKTVSMFSPMRSESALRTGVPLEFKVSEYPRCKTAIGPMASSVRDTDSMRRSAALTSVRPLRRKLAVAAVILASAVRNRLVG